MATDQPVTYSASATEHFVTEFKTPADPSMPESMFIDLSKYQIFSADLPTVALVYGGTPDKIAIVVWNLGPGQENERHVHPTIDHIHVVLTGEAQYNVGDSDPVTLRQGQAVMVPAGVVHGIRNTGTEPCSYLAVTTPGPYEKVLESDWHAEA
jgi:quercetin dioxygenase-like cupin family protein